MGYGSLFATYRHSTFSLLPQQTEKQYLHRRYTQNPGWPTVAGQGATIIFNNFDEDN